MNIVNYISTRYLFSKTSSQAIHWITAISILGISIGTASLLLVLSVFNGFEELLSSLFSKHNPDIKIVSNEGKRFYINDSTLYEIKKLESVLTASKTLEETALFQYGSSQDFGTIKGVDEKYSQVILLDSAIQNGKMILTENGYPCVVMGIGLSNKLGIDLENPIEELRLFIPVDQDINPPNFANQSMRTLPLLPKGIFSIHQEQDYELALTDLGVLQKYLNVNGLCSSLELKLSSETNSKKIISQLEKILGPGFIVKDRYKQDEAFLKIMNLEKWLYYALFSLTLVLVCFTLIGTLWMIVLEKRMDISILKSLGMENVHLRRVFRRLGITISAIGLIVGFLLAVVFYFLQKKYAIVGVPDEFIIDSYPIKLNWKDFIIVGITVLLIGYIASLLPSKKVNDIPSIFREE